MPKLSRKRSARRPYERLAYAFLGLVVIVGIVVLLASLARVRVSITPRAEPIVVDVDIPLVGSGSVKEGEIGGRLARVDGTAEARVAVGESANSETTANGPPERARGTVSIVSRFGSPQPLVATTRLLATDGTLFRIEKAAVVPSNGRVDNVSVYADRVGARGNIGPSKFTIPGLSGWLQERIWAESAAPMSGGSGMASELDKEKASAPVVREADVERTRIKALDAARADIDERVRAMTKNGERVIVLDEASDVKITGAVGDARESLSASARLTRSVIFVAADAFATRARRELEAATLTSGRVLRSERADQLRTRVLSYDAARGLAIVALHAEGEAVFADSGERVFDPSRVAGFTAEEVATYLRSIPGIADVEVRLWPFWVKHVPTNVGTVEVEMRESVK
ncbi:MAG: hypothetical protein V1723_00485 [Candidatus Uhrbacteria bacterium]